MDVKTIRELAELMSQCNLVELEYEQDNSRVRLARGQEVLASNGAPKAIENTASNVEAAKEDTSVSEYIKCPLVGTFYRSSSPENPPLVSEGSRVEPGTIVCIVEAMKVMNEIKAEKAGIVTKVLVENSSPVEFGQPMFELKPLDAHK